MIIRLRRLSYPLGAEVCDIDVSAPIGESAFGEIYRALLDHGILLWDNRSTMHQALADFDQTQSRYMERTTVHGTPSRYVVVNA